MKKLYFQNADDEMCSLLEDHLDYAKSEGLTEIELFKAEPHKEDGYFWCREYSAVGENGTCGNDCKGYNPRNGKSGCCRWRSNIFYGAGKRVKFKVVKSAKT